MSGHLVDLLAVTAQLQPNSVNASGRNPDRRAEKAEHHHSALASSEFAAGCISLPSAFSRPRVFSGSFRTTDRPRLASPCYPHRTAPATFCLNLLGASDHRARAGLEPRIGRPPCSPAAFPVVTRGEGPVCVPHKCRARKVNRRDYRRPREDAARPRTIADHGDTTAAVGEQLPRRPGPGADLGISHEVMGPDAMIFVF